MKSPSMAMQVSHNRLQTRLSRREQENGPRSLFPEFEALWGGAAWDVVVEERLTSGHVRVHWCNFGASSGAKWPTVLPASRVRLRSEFCRKDHCALIQEGTRVCLWDQHPRPHEDVPSEAYYDGVVRNIKRHYHWGRCECSFTVALFDMREDRLHPQDVFGDGSWGGPSGPGRALELCCKPGEERVVDGVTGLLLLVRPTVPLRSLLDEAACREEEGRAHSSERMEGEQLWGAWVLSPWEPGMPLDWCGDGSARSIQAAGGAATPIALGHGCHGQGSHGSLSTRWATRARTHRRGGKQGRDEGNLINPGMGALSKGESGRNRTADLQVLPGDASGGSHPSTSSSLESDGCHTFGSPPAPLSPTGAHEGISPPAASSSPVSLPSPDGPLCPLSWHRPFPTSAASSATAPSPLPLHMDSPSASNASTVTAPAPDATSPAPSCTEPLTAPGGASQAAADSPTASPSVQTPVRSNHSQDRDVQQDKLAGAGQAIQRPWLCEQEVLVLVDDTAPGDPLGQEQASLVPVAAGPTLSPLSRSAEMCALSLDDTAPPPGPEGHVAPVPSFGERALGPLSDRRESLLASVEMCAPSLPVSSRERGTAPVQVPLAASDCLLSSANRHGLGAEAESWQMEIVLGGIVIDVDLYEQQEMEEGFDEGLTNMLGFHSEALPRRGLFERHSSESRLDADKDFDEAVDFSEEGQHAAAAALGEASCGGVTPSPKGGPSVLLGGGPEGPSQEDIEEVPLGEQLRFECEEHAVPRLDGQEGDAEELEGVPPCSSERRRCSVHDVDGEGHAHMGAVTEEPVAEADGDVASKGELSGILRPADQGPRVPATSMGMHRGATDCGLKLGGAAVLHRGAVKAEPMHVEVRAGKCTPWRFHMARKRPKAHHKEGIVETPLCSACTVEGASGASFLGWQPSAAAGALTKKAKHKACSRKRLKAKLRVARETARGLRQELASARSELASLRTDVALVRGRDAAAVCTGPQVKAEEALDLRGETPLLRGGDTEAPMGMGVKMQQSPSVAQLRRRGFQSVADGGTAGCQLAASPMHIDAGGAGDVFAAAGAGRQLPKATRPVAEAVQSQPLKAGSNCDKAPVRQAGQNGGKKVESFPFCPRPFEHSIMVEQVEWRLSEVDAEKLSQAS